MIFAELFAKLGLKVDKASFSTADRLIGAVKKGLGAIVAYKTVDYFRGLVMSTAEAADNLSALASSIGVGIEPLQQLSYASDVSGGSADLMTSSLQRLSAKIGDAARGSKGARKELAALGVNFRGVADGSVPLDDALGAIADRFAAMPEGERASAAMDLFGKAGAAMVPLLAKGRAGVDELRAEFAAMGGQLSGESAESLAEFNDGVKGATYQIRAMATGAVLDLLPTLKDLLARFREWVKANRALIRQKIASILKGIVTGLKAVAKVAKVAAEVFDWMARHIALVLGTVLVVAITALIAKFIALEAGSVAAAIKSAVAWAVAAAPLVLIALLIAAIILVIEDLWSAFTGGESVLKDVYTWLVDLFVEAIEWWVDAFDRFFGWIKEKIDWLLDKLEAIPRGIKAAAKAINSYLTGENSTDYVDPAMLAGRARAAARSASAAVSPTIPRRSVADVPAGAAPNLSTSVIVNTPPGLDPAQVGEHVATKVREENERVLRKTAARNRGR